MVICNGDNSGEVTTISYSQRVKASEVKRCVAKVRDQMGHLKHGFLLLVDLTSLESMDEACAPEVGALMNACNAKGLSSVSCCPFFFVTPIICPTTGCLRI